MICRLSSGGACLYKGLSAAGGKLLGKIFVGEVSNLVFAGDVLVMLRETEVLAVQLSTRGVVLPGMFSPAV